jgi:uncharacterized glyoxalase superfamily protein PhnB
MSNDGYAIHPYLYYHDGVAAMEFLERAFGFRERMRQVDQDGTLRHGEMEIGGAGIMLGSPTDFRTPKELGQSTCGIYVNLPDVDAHHARAVAAGAEVDGPPVDQPYGARSYGVRDPEGQQWWFAQEIAVTG